MLVGAEKGDCPAHRSADKVEEVAVVESREEGVGKSG